jgi:RimJ/RimL family protein N-acetyltransferase
MRTERLEIRPVVESDRQRYVGLFMDSDFMVFSSTGSLDREAANVRFDHMMAYSRTVPFAKQAIVEIATASTIGYVGADEFEFRGEYRLEFGYRLIREARGFGYATEAARVLLEVARRHWRGELLAFIDPGNGSSRNVLIKSGFEFVESTEVRGDHVDLYRCVV